MNKRELIEILVNELRLIDGGISPLTASLPANRQYTFELDCHENVYPYFMFMEEINDFPTICFYIVEESIAHIGAGIRYKTAVVSLRGYVHEALGEEEGSNWWSEALIDDIDHVLSRIPERNPCIVDLRVLQLSTDEGIMAPYGVSDIIFTITYEAE